tara:strand:- start:65 stop:352 length:288 start_codon:yes stop_codon:yes gene_type:complete
MAYFIYFIWQWVTKTIDPVIAQAQGTLIALVDRVRMLDNDMIRLNTKLAMLLEHYEKEGKPIDGDLEEIVKKYGSNSEQFVQKPIGRNASDKSDS